MEILAIILGLCGCSESTFTSLLSLSHIGSSALYGTQDSWVSKIILVRPWCCSVTQLCLIICDPMDCSTPGFCVFHYFLEFAQIRVHWIDAIQPSHSLLLPSSLAFNLSQHQGLFQWVCSSHQVAKVLELQLQRQSFQWVFRVDFL